MHDLFSTKEVKYILQTDSENISIFQKYVTFFPLFLNELRTFNFIIYPHIELIYQLPDNDIFDMESFNSSPFHETIMQNRFFTLSFPKIILCFC